MTTTQLTDAGRQISHVRFEAGADWRAEVGAELGMQWCEQPHRVLVLSGGLEIEFRSGEVRQVHRGDFADLPGSHNATAGGQACSFLEFDPPSGTTASLPLCVLLWPHDGQDDGMAAYEDKVLALLADHGGRLLARVRRSSPDDGPREVQIIELPDDAALNSYLADPRRTALAAVRDDVVARTDVIRIDQPLG